MATRTMGDKGWRVTPPVYGTNWWILIYLKWKNYSQIIFLSLLFLQSSKNFSIKDMEEMQYVYFKICAKEELTRNKCANQTVIV